MAPRTTWFNGSIASAIGISDQTWQAAIPVDGIDATVL